MTDCIFCKILSKNIPSNIVFENENVLAFLDNKPISKGHVLVMPKKHFETLSTTPDELVQELILVTKKVADAAVTSLEADGYNVGINNGPASGQVIMHTHFHIIPRYKDDGLKHWPNKDTTDDALKTVQQKILVNLM